MKRQHTYRRCEFCKRTLDSLGYARHRATHLDWDRAEKERAKQDEKKKLEERKENE